MTIKQLPYGEPVKKWLAERYGVPQAKKIWHQTKKNYQNYLSDLPDYGGSKNGHAKAIYDLCPVSCPAGSAAGL